MNKSFNLFVPNKAVCISDIDTKYEQNRIR